MISLDLAGADEECRNETDDRGEIVEQAPPDRLFSEPSDERTRRFLRRITDPGRL
jgi:ABC-type dipeptide/oligopeptide/nickel transport system ATPase component